MHHPSLSNKVNLLAFICIGLACLSAIAMSEEDADIESNEAQAIQSTKAYAAAQDIYRRTDWDKDGVLEYSTSIRGDFSLFEVEAGAGDVALVDAAFAKAAGSPVKLEDKDIPQSDKATDEAITKLSPDLAAEDYATRAAASEALEKLGSKAIRPLQKLAEDAKDPETSNRCKVISKKLLTALKTKLGGAQLTATPKYGYCFKILTGQGKNAPGMQKTYITQNKNMTLGYALIAFPATYGKTGGHSFIINNAGVVYQKDLGKDTVSIATKMTEYDPDIEWVVAE